MSMNELGIVKRNIERADRAAVEKLWRIRRRPPSTRPWAASA